MNTKPSIKTLNNNSVIWSNDFDTFSATVYVPETDLAGDIINFGYDAPYSLVFSEKKLSEDEAIEYAKESGLAKIASEYASSVVFVYPKNGWENADETLWQDLIKNSKIHQYHEDGMAVLVNRFTHSTDGYAIRGAIFRTNVYADGKAADFVATKLLKTINGEGLWGPADVSVCLAVLSGMTKCPVIERSDIPVVSVGNSKEINKAFAEKCDIFLAVDKASYSELYKNFVYKYRRWVGNLVINPDFEAINMVEEPGIFEITTSPDNSGDDKGTKTHRIGYIAYYNNNLFENGPAPLVLTFHGGGDSAKYIAKVSEWYRVAHDHNFLLVCIEDHLNSTATEMIEFIGKLKEKYSIDSTRIYGTGFSMGGCKSWDLYQEYPEVFAGLAPMDATFEVGLNVYGEPAPKEINKDVLVPIFYVGGEVTPLPELPFQAQKCIDRMAYTLKVNDIDKDYDVKLDNLENWVNPIFGIDGDDVWVEHDDDRNADLTINLFKSRDEKTYTAFGSVSGQGHECRYHTCEIAYRFLSKFQRVDGKIKIN